MPNSFEMGSQRGAFSDRKINVHLDDPRIVKAGIDPNSLLGKGITEAELQARLKKVQGVKNPNPKG